MSTRKVALAQIDATTLDVPGAENPLAQQTCLVLAIERVLAVLNRMRATSNRREHTFAAGHLRTALDWERRVLAEMQQRNVLIGAAVARAGEDA